MKRILKITFPFCFLLSCFIFFAAYYPYHLHFKEQTVLFPGFDMVQYLQKPAWLSEMSGDYLTQFFLLRGGGAFIVAVSLFLLWGGLSIAFGRMRLYSAHSIACLPVAAEWILSTHLEYPLSMTIGAIFSVWMFLLISYIRNKYVSWFLFIALATVLYVLSGGHMLLFALLYTYFRFNTDGKVFPSSVLICIAMSIPLLVGKYFLLTPAQAYFYPIVEGYMLKTPFFYLTTEVAVCMALALGKSKYKPYMLNILILGCTFVGLCFRINLQEEHELGLMCEAYYGHWDKLEKMARQQKYNSYLTAYYGNLSQARRGKLPDTLLERYQPASYGLLMETKGNVSYLNIMAGPDALILYGDLEQAQRAAMLGMVFTPKQRSSRMVRRLVEINIQNGDKDTAKKFLHLLSKTLFHQKWAERQLYALENNIPVRADYCIASNDVLFSPNDMRSSITNLLKSCHDNKTAIDYLLCYDLLCKELEHFKVDYDAYYFPIFGKAPSVLYQEALLMIISDCPEFGSEQLAHYHILHSEYRKMQLYVSAFHQNKDNVEWMQRKFGNTYWFYHFYSRLK